jgi:hypothetical protein
MSVRLLPVPRQPIIEAMVAFLGGCPAEKLGGDT